MTWRNDETLETLADELTKIKRYMDEAKQRKDEIEQKIFDMSGLTEQFEGTHSMEAGHYAVKIRCKFNRKINSDELQKIAQKAGLSSYLSELFRWKPEIKKREWDKASPEVTSVLEQAIVTTSAKPFIQIDEEV